MASDFSPNRVKVENEAGDEKYNVNFSNADDFCVVFFFESGAKPEPSQPVLVDPAAFSRFWNCFAVDFGSVRCVDNLGDSESVVI